MKQYPINEWIYTSKSDQQNISVTQCDVKNAKAVVLIVHGMMEHQDRYQGFREALAQAQFSSLALDVRGHGRSLFDGTKKGHFADEKGWHRMLEDIDGILQVYTQKHDCPVILFGHSLGSVMVRSYLNYFDHAQIKAVCLSGSPAYSPIIPVMHAFVKFLGHFRPAQSESPHLTQFTLLTYQMAIKSAKTRWDWLSYNPKNIENYQQDPLCGFPFTLGSLQAMMEGLMDVYQKRPSKTPAQIPVHFISGQDDPCHQPTGLEAALNKLQRDGYQNLSLEYIPQARHEFLHELQAQEITESLIKRFNAWIA